MARIKAKLKGEDIRQFYTTLSGFVIYKDSWSEVDDGDRDIKRLIQQGRIEIKDIGEDKKPEENKQTNNPKPKKKKEEPKKEEPKKEEPKKEEPEPKKKKIDEGSVDNTITSNDFDDFE